MFCDLVGSTALAKRLDPEELRELLGQYQDTCAAVVDRFDGYIARYVGDGVLVYFGYPKAHEDDAQRAVRAGLDIVEDVKKLDEKIEYLGITLAVRIGITTGLVVVGDIGSSEKHEQKGVVGETPNLAARLQELAQPGAVVIGASTWRLVEGLFACEELAPQQLKGLSEPVVAYRVGEESGTPSRFEAAASRGLTPLVGREEEVGLLLKRWTQAKEREAQIVLLSGEAGVGKSRIARGFRERLEGEPHNRVLYYGSPFHQNSALYPPIDQLKRGLRFEKGDSSAQKVDKLEAVLNRLGLRVADYAPVLALLLSLPPERYPPLRLTPDQLKRKTLEAIVAMIDAMALQQPVLMVVEDAQWLDPSTIELLSLAIEVLRGARFLFLCISRPEFKTPWEAHANVTVITLSRLSRKESGTLVTRVARGKALPTDVVEQIVTKADGVPLFVEELTKTLLESGMLEEMDDHYALLGPLPPFAIPASLQDSLMARLDRLAPAKELAQLAATLGRAWDHALLAAVAPIKEKALEDALMQLIEAELIYRRGLPPDVIYEFKHALVRDAAYQSLLKSTRQQYHRVIAQVLQRQFPETAMMQPELLAHHCTEAGLAEEAITYWQKANERAVERYAHVEAVAHLRHGLELIKTLPDMPERARQELAMYLRQAESLHFLGRYQEITKLLLEQRKHFEVTRDPSLAARYFFALGQAYSFLGDPELTAENAQRSIEEAKACGDEVTMGKAHSVLALEGWRTGCLEDGLAHGRQAVVLLEHTDESLWLGWANYRLAFNYYMRGEFESALEAASRIDSIGETIDSRRLQTHAAMITGMSYTIRGDWDAGVEACRRALELSPDPYESAFVRGFLGQAYLERRDSVRATATLTQALEEAKRVRSRMVQAWFTIFLGEAYSLEGKVKAATKLLEHGLEVSGEVNFPWGVGLAQRSLARLFQNKGNLDEARSSLDVALQTFGSAKANFELARTQLALAKFNYAAGNREKAEQDITVAVRMFEALQTPKYATKALELARHINSAEA
jgi:predicted ATPase/class 3 adenylate cyclase